MRLPHLYLAVLLLAGGGALAEGTRLWQQSSFEDFEKGTAQGVAIRSNGLLELAPEFKAVATTPSTYIWSIASDKEGNAYVAAGGPARVYRVTPAGKITTLFQPEELQVQALAVESSSVIYAATSPDGKVYKIERRASNGKSAPQAAQTAEKSAPVVDNEWTSSVFYEPKTKYIWALALDGEGRLYIATGDHGEIYRVDRHGDGSLFLKSDEAHIRALALDPKGNIIAGSDGSGLVYRISPKGEAFVLYSAPKKEITALAVDFTGNIYASGAGEKRAGEPATSSLSALSLSSASNLSALPGLTPSAPSLPVSPTAAAGSGGSEIYRIAPDGLPRRIWASREDLVYALGFDAQGQLIAGTGNKGRLYAIHGDQDFTDLLKASATQITGFANAANGQILVATSNLGKVFLLGSHAGGEGDYVSDVFDARIFSRWGRMRVRGEGGFDLWLRAGNVDNPDRNWSSWAKVDLRKDEPSAVPPARFVQWKVVLRPGAPPAEISSVGLYYLPRNAAPVVDEVSAQLGVRYQPLTRPPGESSGSEPPGPGRVEVPPPPQHDPQSMGIHWSAHDDNDDQLVYALYYRGDGEARWKLLKDKISDKFYSFDSSLLPDGGYMFKVVASDAPSNPPPTALTGERESARVEIDTTPPRIEDLHAGLENGRLHIVFRATDSYSAIKRAEISVDAGEWQFVAPVGEISDERAEKYDIFLPEPGGTEHVVVVRVWDRFDNAASGKTLVGGK